MSGKKAKDVDVYILAELAEIFVGRAGKRVVNAIADKGPIRDDELSKALGMSENEVRRILWRLSDHTLVTTRKEVNSESGWITYYWQLPLEQAKGILYNIVNEVAEKLEKKLEYERGNIFFWCGREGCPRYTFDKATELMFRCGSCGDPLKPFDNSELVAALTWMIGRLRRVAGRLIERA